MTVPAFQGPASPARRSRARMLILLLAAALASIAPAAAVASGSRGAHTRHAPRRTHAAHRRHAPRRAHARRIAPPVEVTPLNAAPLSTGGPPLTSEPAAPSATPAQVPPAESSSGARRAPGRSSAGSSPAGSPPAAQPEAGPEAELTDPIDPRYLTQLPFGSTSFWDQPWRAYLDTWPGSHLLESVGINFNVPPEQSEAAAQLLQEDGFKLARMSINWNDLSYTEPDQFRPVDLVGLRRKLAALRNHGLRPLVVLDAFVDAPTPYHEVKLTTVEPAPAGARTVTLDPASAAEVVPGRTGFNYLIFEGAPDELITSVGPGDVAHLARPLVHPLPAGEHGGTTLLYSPFAPPTLADGQPNPEFRETLAGWLAYVATVTRFLAAEMGPGGFDLEVWNELTFGSQFLNSETYYWPQNIGSAGPAAGGARAASSARAKQKAANSAAIRRAVLDETVAYVRSAAAGLSPSVGITDGFASETPFPSGADATPGLTALSKHPYASLRAFPEQYKSNGAVPLNALGEADIKSHERSPFTPLFTPTYHVLMPEFMLTGVTAETTIRDVAPLTTGVYGYPHGRYVAPAGATSVQKWITEYNLPIPKAELPALTPADQEHFHTKALLRSLVANISKGFSREYMFAADGGEMSIIDQGFFGDLLSHPGTYPGNAAGGEVLASLRNLLAQFQGPGPSGEARQLALLRIGQDGDHAQFTGDGTAAHPTLYDREMLAVFPYQVSPTRFVIPTYVMSTNLLALYEPDAPSTDVRRYDMPDETFRITLGDLPETEAPPSVSAYDPILNTSTPARLLKREGSTATFEFAATDYPRLLILEYPSS